MRYILAILIRSQRFAFAILALALIGFTGYQVVLATSIVSDPAYVNTQITVIDSKRVKFDPATTQAVSNLLNISGQTDTSGPGKSDPFSP